MFTVCGAVTTRVTRQSSVVSDAPLAQAPGRVQTFGQSGTPVPVELRVKRTHVSGAIDCSNSFTDWVQRLRGPRPFLLGAGSTYDERPSCLDGLQTDKSQAMWAVQQRRNGRTATT